MYSQKLLEVIRETAEEHFHMNSCTGGNERMISIIYSLNHGKWSFHECSDPHDRPVSSLLFD